MYANIDWRIVMKKKKTNNKKQQKQEKQELIQNLNWKRGKP